MTRSREIHLASRPTGLPGPETYRLTERDLAVPVQGEVLVQIRWLSLDPYMRGRMNDAKSYVARGYCGILVGVVVMLASYLVGFNLGRFDDVMRVTVRDKSEWNSDDENMNEEELLSYD